MSVKIQICAEGEKMSEEQRTKLEEMTIGEIISLLGPEAGKVIDAALCSESPQQVCCPRTTLRILPAAILTGKEEKVPEIFAELEKLRG